MQVFNEVGGATGSNFIAEAINDAIKLKADTINMSLSMGNVGNTRSGDKIIENAINKATSAGITVAVAAGNYGSSAYPKLEVRRDNFDYGTLRDMAAFENSFSVASFNNEKLYTNYIKIVGSEVIVPAYLTDGFAGAAISNNFNREEEKELEVIDAGIGTDEDFKRLKEQGVKFEGKAVIMRRQPGTLYVTKVGNAKKYGALLAIVYNNVGDELQSMGVGDYSSSMPSLFIGQKAGEEIVKTKAKVVLGKGSIVIDNPNKGKMSDFSSWGATIDLGFKPEITAPGEGIYSTNTGAPDEYISMNGTSMASPHIAGASLILRQYLKDKAPELANRDDISYVVKNIMMSTAKPVIEPLSNVEYSPRKEGAGLVDLKAATETRVYAYEKNTKESKVNLKELQENESFDIDLKNFGDTTASYKVSLVINTDLVNENHITLRPRRISEQDIGRIDVKPKSIAEQKVTINVSKEEQRKLIEDMPNGFWIEGFVYFKSEKPEEYPDLSIPFISLKTKGNLNAGAVGVIEPLIYDLNKGLNNLNMFYNEKNNEEVGRYQSYSPIEQYKTIGLEVGGTLENLKARKDKIAISPNGDGISDNIMPKLVLNRYISRIFFGIEKDGKNIIETSAMSGSKLDQFKGVFFNSNLILTVNDDIKDGEYDLVTTAITDYSEAGIRNESSDYENDEKYVLKNKIIIDRNKPRVTKVEVFGNKAILNFTDQYPEFKGSGVKLVEIKDKSPGNIIAIKDDQTSLSIILPEGKTVKDTKVAIEDWAGNRLEGTIEELKEKQFIKLLMLYLL
ncbi:subtilisin family serine protease [Peptoniphilus indolicus ATCC 29427]|uniref:Subtilisin family serine protease n=2 Tax=Peptoniphilus indolicus TaxID=33030 RepID=G4D1M0_9FIRM|nr:subtilisin family serine protease [Peptoniphilus indolicus ATCC 29427]